MRFLILPVCLFLSSALAGQSQGHTGLSQIREKTEITSSFQYIKDENLDLSLDSALTMADSNWKNMDSPYFGLSNSTFWFRASFYNDLSSDHDWVMILNDYPIHKATFYMLSEENLVDSLASGASVPIQDKPLNATGVQFPLQIPQGEVRTILLKVEARSFFRFSPRVIKWEEFFRDREGKNIALGFAYGVMGLIILYNLLLLVSTRKVVFFHFTLFALSIALLTASFDGMLSRYCYGLILMTRGYQDIIAALLSEIFVTLFLIRQLHLKYEYPRIYRLCMYYISAGIILLLIIPFNAQIAYIGGVALFAPIIITAIYLDLDQIRQGRVYGIYYLIAALTIAFFVGANLLHLLGLAPTSTITVYGIQIGFLLFPIIISYGLLLQVRAIRDEWTLKELEKEQALKKVITEKNYELEQRIGERTALLTQRESDLRATLNNNDNLIWLINRQLEVVDLNENFKNSYYESFGIKLKPGMNILENVSDPDIKNMWQKRYEKAFEDNSDRYVDSYEFTGERRYFEISLHPIVENGIVERVSAFSKDITASRRYQDRLRKSNEDLSKLNSELDRFVYSASHDLKAPLSSISGLINLHRNESDNDLKKKYLDMMQESIDKMNKFIKDIVNFSRNSRLDLEPEEIDFQSMFENIFDSLKFISCPVEIKKQIDIQCSESFYSDKNRLTTIFQNLISNSIRYCDKKKGVCEIICQVAFDQGSVEIKIEDNGLGIDEKYLDDIFDMFYRATEDSSGSGLGLYIVKESVDKLKGKISVDSEPKKGTTFTITLPNMKDATSETSSPSP